MAQLDESGLDALTIRGVAAALGVAPNALYRYFKSLSDLRGALSERSQQRLLQAMQEGSNGKAPAAAIRGIAQAYLAFAKDHRPAFLLTLYPSSVEGDEAAHRQSWRFVSAQVARLYGEAAAPEATVALWALIHGMTALEDAGVVGGIKPSSGLEFGLKMWLERAESRA